jgi:hypothetical protein
MNPSTLVWIHGDSLSPHDPAAKRHPGAPRVFVFDRPMLQSAPLSFKRLHFIYECASEAADEIRVGDPVEELEAACQEHGCTRIAVTASPAPRFGEIAATLSRRLDLEVIPAEDLVSVPDGYLPRRFSQFWKKYGLEWS